MLIRLKKVGKVRGIYGISKNLFPERAALMHPDAAAALMQLEVKSPLVYSDMLRGADESLRACKAGRGAQPPGYSGHNFGFSIDVAVDQILREKGWTYERLVGTLETHNFHPYRQDRTRGPEDWHFNYLGKHSDSILRRTQARHLWQTAADEMIKLHYPTITPLGALGIQEALKKLKLYSGDLDGDLGPLSAVSIELFNKSWGISYSATGERFQRTLAYVAADIEVVA